MIKEVFFNNGINIKTILLHMFMAVWLLSLTVV